MSTTDATVLTDHETFAEGPPHPMFDAIRAETPLADSGVGPEGNRLWAVCRHADIAEVSRSTDRFSSNVAGIFPNSNAVFNLMLTQNLLLYKDPPDHTKFRKILQTAFVPNSVNKRQEQVRATIDAFIDGVIERGECDFVKQIAVPFPLSVLMDLMGLPREDIHTLEGWIDAIEAATISGVSDEANPVMMEMAPYLLEQITRQKEAGTESLVVTLANAVVDGESMKDEEILVFFGLLVFAGNDTTRNTLANGMRVLLEHPEQMRMLVDDPSLIPNAVEEILRYTSVVQYFCRTATADTELSGCPVGEGDKVMIWYTAGSRDPGVNDDPHRFDITRDSIEHMAFGGGGRHFCLGAGLARQELRVAFEQILGRMENIELADAPVRKRTNWANALTSMPITFRSGSPLNPS